MTAEIGITVLVTAAILAMLAKLFW
jgi:hypothetical protein